MPTFSKRAKDAEINAVMVGKLIEFVKNPYNSATNPDGIVNLASAQNKLMHDIVNEKLSQVDLSQMPAKYQHYSNFAGIIDFREALAKFVNRYMKPTEAVSAWDLTVYNGCSSAIEALAFVLCNPGEGMLVPSPYYSCFRTDLKKRNNVQVCPFFFPCGESPEESVREVMEESLTEWKNKGVTVKAVLVSNPDNPTGNVYSLQRMRSILEFCSDHDLHLICDEVYLLSVHDESTKMESILSIPSYEKYRNIVHTVWAFSKDLGVSGFRCGVLISHNSDLHKSLHQTMLFSSTSHASQYITQCMIEDFDWVDKFVSTNHEHLRAALGIVTRVFDELSIEYVRPRAGLFVWFSLRKFLPSPASRTSQEEQEEAICDLFLKNGVFIAPGFDFNAREYGWFRLVFAGVCEDELNIALERIRKTVLTMTT